MVRLGLAVGEAVSAGCWRTILEGSRTGEGAGSVGWVAKGVEGGWPTDFFVSRGCDIVWGDAFSNGASGLVLAGDNG